MANDYRTSDLIVMLGEGLLKCHHAFPTAYIESWMITTLCHVLEARSSVCLLLFSIC